MKLFSILFILFFSNLICAQVLKKKAFGTYSAIYPAYFMEIGSEAIAVKETEIVISISNLGDFKQIIGDQEKEGTWTLVSKTRKMYVLEVRFSNQHLKEELIIYKRKKIVFRAGVAPQPSISLKKKKK